MKPLLDYISDSHTKGYRNDTKNTPHMSVRDTPEIFTSQTLGSTREYVDDIRKETEWDQRSGELIKEARPSVSPEMMRFPDGAETESTGLT
ncbi:hypothetical protein SKAU_G00216930 [Synaphobranchus kaupii]|uniref:Uncharacterized protein n=1 Tax=Synaphobranchus kaupii TaxID=118154 RepID=A0A9Q1FAL2_SYNKA|nr:hypothetical protein SKAU_G00216930 [Synaphobranchus kaupii]